MANAWLRHAADASRLLSEAEALARQSHPELLGEVELRRGAVAFLGGELTEAEKAYEDALQIARIQKDSYAEVLALAGLGAVATKEERFDESIDWHEAALKLAHSLDAKRSLTQILGNMGWAYRRLGDFDSALAFYKRAEEMAALGGFVNIQIYWLTGASNVYYLQNDYEAAKAVLARGLDLARSQENKRTLTEYMNDLAEIELEVGQIESAERYCKEAIQLERGSLEPSELLSSQLVGGRIDVEKHDYAQAEKLFHEVAEDPKADTAQKCEAGARLARVYADMGQRAKAEVEFRRSVAVVETARRTVQAVGLQLSFLSSVINFYDDYVDFLVSQHRTEDALRVAELSRARTLEEGLATTADKAKPSSSALHPQQLAKRLKATVLFYWIGRNQSYLWVITPGKVVYFTLPKAAEIEPVVQSYEKAVLTVRDAQDAGNAVGKRLYAILVEPAKKLIPQGSRVIVLPDESLYGLNFETLVVPNPQPHFWIEDVTLTTASSLTLLERSAAGSLTKERNLLLFGNTEQANAEFSPLPQAPAEIQKVGRYFSDRQRKVLEGKQATPSAYLSSNPESFAYLHFVTHGTASHTRPLESAVILSKEGDSYKLYARDIVQHHLNANLVTISACNGSGTRAYSGEGLVGLSWAFLRAGAHNVIGALWEVSDASTPQLMDTLYGELSEGKDPATALRDAKLRLLHSQDSKSVFKKPFYWAPFQLYTGS
ncbi:MAG TPA: CHAT domain-containing protein, partial [Candidatus Dormibacteraeota bacterium]|nr:CHAT domain-containing protein [Candidatus Dormibacteraeota bacterium]